MVSSYNTFGVNVDPDLLKLSGGGEPAPSRKPPRRFSNWTSIRLRGCGVSRYPHLPVRKIAMLLI